MRKRKGGGGCGGGKGGVWVEGRTGCGNGAMERLDDSAIPVTCMAHLLLRCWCSAACVAALQAGRRPWNERNSRTWLGA